MTKYNIPNEKSIARTGVVLKKGAEIVKRVKFSVIIPTVCHLISASFLKIRYVVSNFLKNNTTVKSCQ